MKHIQSYTIAWLFNSNNGAIYLELIDANGNTNTVTFAINDLAQLVHIDTLLRNNNEVDFDEATTQMTYTRPTQAGTRVRFVGSVSGG